MKLCANLYLCNSLYKTVRGSEKTKHFEMKHSDFCVKTI